MKLVCISDTHELHRSVELPECDVLVHAGDFTMSGKPKRVADFNAWLGEQKKAGRFREAIVIAGNHELTFEDPVTREMMIALITNARYLEDSGCEIGGVKFWGSPWQPEFHEWAFNLPRGKPLEEKWSKIPAGTNVLITHGPPMGILDWVNRGENVGCEALLARVKALAPTLHLFGHIHEGYGVVEQGATRFGNASVCDFGYAAVNAPLVFEL